MRGPPREGGAEQSQQLNGVSMSEEVGRSITSTQVKIVGVVFRLHW